MTAQSFIVPTEDEIAEAVKLASFQGWPADERDLVELISVVLDAPTPADLERPTGAAGDPYRFLYSVR
ncbi:MAG: hypothetical protein QM681_09765 [Novosphingobium sp.]